MKAEPAKLICVNMKHRAFDISTHSSSAVVDTIMHRFTCWLEILTEATQPPVFPFSGHDSPPWLSTPQRCALTRQRGYPASRSNRTGTP